MKAYKVLGKETPCAPCPKPELWPENQEAWEYYCLMAGQQIVAGMGSPIGVSFQAIQFVFDTFDVPAAARRELFEKIIVIDRLATKRRMEKDQKAIGKKPQADPKTYRKGGR